MGIIYKGILGGFQGTVGTVVGGTWKGINYIKSLPVISNTDPTPRQLEQREKFRTMINFLRPIIPFVQEGFKNVAGQMTGYNSAMAFNYRSALSGNYPTFTIDYSMAAVTNGSLPNVLAPSAVADPGSVVKFNWTNNAFVGKAKTDDLVMLVVYCPETKEAIYRTGPELRGDATASVNAAQFAGKIVHTWISCKAATGTDVAKSQYTGQLTVS
jgi:hypothetical protein